MVAVGTGQAIDMARRGDADVLFVHDTAAEEKFVAEGFAAKRFPVMYNDFVLVGPKSDPAGAKGKDIVAALKKIAAANAPFVSRGDKSGTDAAERRAMDADRRGRCGPAVPNDKKGSGYKECGCGMGPALNIAASSDAYVLADRGTWLSFKNRGRPGGAGRRRQAPVQPVRRDGREPGEVSAASRRPARRSSSTG